MPTQSPDRGKALYVSEAEIKSRIGLNLKAEPVECASSGPATSYCLPDAPGRISFISAVSRCFCDTCNRLRLTSRGDLLGCLYLNNGADLRGLLADGASIDEIAGHICDVVATPGFRRLPQQTSVVGINPYMRKVGG